MPVLVNPNKPLSLDDFAQIYTSGGRTPQENASGLWFNAPTEGRNYMDQQWSNLGTGTFPEQYFSNPDHVAAQIATSNSPSVRVQPNALGQIPVSPGNTGSAQWPMYANEDARQTAMNLGMDKRASYTTPDRMTASVTSHLSSVPHDADHLLNDPQLQSLMAVDPSKAKFVYEKLTGANYDKDKAEFDSIDKNQKVAALNEQRKFQRAPMEFGIKTVQDLISRGAHFDPNTGKLSTWQNVQPDASAIDQRPIRQRIPATPEEKYIWDHYYPFAMGMPSPQGHVDPRLQAANEAVAKLPTAQSQRVQSQIQRWKDLGLDVTSEKVQAIIDKDSAENRPLISAPGEDSHFQDFANSFVGGLSGRQNWSPDQTVEQSMAQPKNAWGHAADWMFGLQDKAMGYMDRLIPPVPDRFKTSQQRAEDEAARQAAAGVVIPGMPSSTSIAPTTSVPTSTPVPFASRPLATPIPRPLATPPTSDLPIVSDIAEWKKLKVGDKYIGGTDGKIYTRER